jgi:glycosyltransferase involved in cell wall biosynthesis
MEASVLYISYDGLLDPLGQSQVLPYVRELARRGTTMRVISFEKPELTTPEAIGRIRNELEATGAKWYPLRYHSSPTVPATVWDIWQGIKLARKLAQRERINIIHARSYIAGMIALAVKRQTGAKFLFDMRGFWPDERVEGGSWKQGGVLFKTFKHIEQKLLAGADGIVSLTHRGVDIITRDLLPNVRRDIPPMAVIPTCADLELFRPSLGRVLPGDSGIKLVYLGSLGSWYMLEPMLAFFAALKHQAPGSTLRLLTGSPAPMVEEAARALQLDKSVRDAISIGKKPHDQVPLELAGADCSIFFIRPSFSKQASCATKFAESLACGVPVVINSGVGDHDNHLRNRGIGIVLDKLDEQSYESAARELLELLANSETSDRCRSAAEQGFSLAGAVKQYGELYGRLIGGGEQR